jgi:hypothetical protein
METQRQNNLVQWVAWGLVLAVCVAALAAWGHTYSWHFLPFNAYITFPLLGLLAFSIMWTHYVMAAVRDIYKIPPEPLKRYFKTTSLVVLGLICLHPGLLIYQRFRDGEGLPPGSYESYVAQGRGWITILGTVALLVFLAFELHRVYGKKPWWPYVRDASDFAMLAILYHSLRLGTDLVHGWYRGLWWFYAIVLIVILIRKYALKLAAKAVISKPGH